MCGIFGAISGGGNRCDARRKESYNVLVAEPLEKPYASQRSIKTGRGNSFTVGQIVKNYFPHLQKMKHFVEADLPYTKKKIPCKFVPPRRLTTTALETKSPKYFRITDV